MAVAASTEDLRGADTLPDARRLLALTTLAVVMLVVTVFAAAMFAVMQINDSSVDAEIERAQVALATMDPTHSEARVASELANSYALNGAHFGDAMAMDAGEIAIPVHGSDSSLIWMPRRLGWELFARLAPLRIAASLVFLASIVALMRRLYLLARELEERRRQAHALASRDPLTGVGNRLAFDEGLERALAEGSGEVAMFYLDLDGFKQVNDTLGHGAGDDVLRIVAKRLDAMALAEPIALGASQMQIGASIGIAVAPADGRSAAELVQAADAALYRAKRDRTGFAMAA
jgi:GGDEF domain-containing protein